MERLKSFLTSDLHLAEWREVVQACLNKEGKGWKPIYEQIKTRTDYLHHTEEELKIEFNKPLEEQDPLDELNDLANKKRKRADDFHDYFRSTKKFKPSVRYEDHPPGKHTTEKPVLAKPAAAPKPAIKTSAPATNVSAKDACPRCRQGFFCSDHDYNILEFTCKMTPEYSFVVGWYM
ncbi:hypothetical protein Tco_0195988 [Tanacetum coccineum]